MNQDENNEDPNLDETTDLFPSSYSLYEKYDPYSQEMNCCVELYNNNKINIQYKETWTICNLIEAIINHKEFKKLYPSREWQLKSMHHFQLFDLHIAFYRSIKPDKETKIFFNISLGFLHKMKLLKSNRYPFFIFKDNSNKFFQSQSSEPYTSITKYQNELPRVNTLFFLEMHPDIAYYYHESKQAINNLSTFNFSELITEKDDLDWFIFDDESINFIASMEKERIDQLSVVKFHEDNIYFEDRYENQGPLSKKEMKNLFISVSYNANNTDSINKIKVTKEMTGMDVIEQVNKKAQMVHKSIKFNMKRSILKVKGLNDYVFSVEEPLISFAYIRECVSKNKTPEFILVDYPFDNLTEEELKQLDEDNKKEKKLLFHYDNQEENSSTYINVMNIGLYDKSSLMQNQRATIIRTSYNINSMNDNNTLNSHIKLPMLGLANSKPKSNTKTNIEGRIIPKTPIGPLNKYRKANNRVFDKTTINKSHYSNEFVDDTMNKINFAEMHKRKKEPIDIKTINRPFNIMLCNADFNSLINPQAIIKEIQRQKELERENSIGDESITNIQNEYNDKRLQAVNKSPLLLLITMELFCGLKSFSARKQIKWQSGNNDYLPLFNKRIYFDRNYNILPNFLTLVFKVNTVSLSKDKSLKAIAWGTFRLFDHNKRLKTGVHKICLFDSLMSVDSYFCNYDNINQNASSISFEIESFSREVVNKITRTKQIKINSPSNKVNETLLQVINQSPFKKLTTSEREIIWNSRLSLLNLYSCLPKLLSCIDYSNAEDVKEIETLLYFNKSLTLVDALNLLTIDFLDESIRAYAVHWLKKESPIEIQKYLLQLIQGLKYEMNHDSELARFILQMAINYPLTIGHNLFWFLRAEMAHQNVQQRFGLYLEVFLNKIGSKIKEVYRDENWLIKELYTISRIPHQKKNGKAANLAEVNQSLSSLNDRIKRDISLPLNFKLRIRKIAVETCKIMNSKKLPLWLTFENADPNGENITVMFKQGDDLRMDMVTLQLFKVMQNIWSEQQLNLKMNIYGVICTGDQQGMLEMVKDSVTIAHIHREEGILSSTMSDKGIMNWQNKNHICSDEEFINNFMLSSVPYCIATFILGITDRHSDNIMIKKNGELFHIDFGHFLGHYKKKLGIQRETTPFVFTKQFKYILDSDNKYEEFKSKMVEAYQLIVSKNEMIIMLMKLLLWTGISELNDETIQFLEETLQIKNAANRVVTAKYITDKLDESLNNIKTGINFAMHHIAKMKEN